MTKIKVKNLNKVQTNLRKTITKALRSKDIQKGVAEIVVSNIKDKNLGTPAPFTKDMRAYLEQSNKTDPKYKRSQITANFTGELLQDLINNIKTRFNRGAATFVVEHSDKGHSQYKQPKGARFSKKKTHKETKFDKKTGKNKTINRTSKIPYKFISTMIIKKHGYNYLKPSRKTEADVLRFIRNKIFNKLK